MAYGCSFAERFQAFIPRVESIQQKKSNNMRWFQIEQLWEQINNKFEPVWLVKY